jgi:hypothetical protein
MSKNIKQHLDIDINSGEENIDDSDIIDES